MLLAGCSRKKRSSGDDDLPIPPEATSASTGAAASAGTHEPAAVAHAQTSAGAKPIPDLAPRLVPAGRVPGSRAWLPKFKLQRDPGDQNRTVLGAFKACAANGMALCTDAQWARACAADASVGAVETWTATFSADSGLVVRGGEGGCSAHKVVSAGQASPSRAGVCCDPAVAIITTNQNAAFLMTVSGKMTRYERGILKESGAALGPLIDDSIRFFASTFTHDQMVSRYDAWFRQWPDQWTIYDTCDVTIQPGIDATWTADCATTAQRAGKLAFVSTRYIWSGEGRVRGVKETNVFRKFTAP